MARKKNNDGRLPRESYSARMRRENREHRQWVEFHGFPESDAHRYMGANDNEVPYEYDN